MWNPILFLLLIFTEGNYENEVSTQKPLTPGGSGLLTRITKSSGDDDARKRRIERRRKKWCDKHMGVEKWVKHDGCTYTMILPNNSACPKSAKKEDKNPDLVATAGFQSDDGNAYETNERVPRSTIDDLYKDWNSLRYELNRQQHQIEVLNSTETNQKRMEDSITRLEEDNQNMNSRVQQLYMQLLHEIVKKKDETLETQSLEKKLLNQTVHLYELEVTLWEMKEQYNKLLRHSSMQSRVIDGLQKTMQHIIKKVGSLTEVVDRLDGVDVPDDSSSSSIENLPIVKKSESSKSRRSGYRDCFDVYQSGKNDSGVYSINLPNGKQVDVLCDLGEKTDSPGWTIFQQRKFGTVDFFRDWADYKHGFGSLDGDFWWGLEHLYQLTKNRRYELLIELTDWTMDHAHASYKHFNIFSEADGYRLNVTDYTGTAGDSLSWHNGQKFTTKDRDNDPFIRNCADYQKAGWWYNICAHSNLNGVYHSGGKYSSNYNDGIYWTDWKGGTYSLKYVTMKLRPKS